MCFFLQLARILVESTSTDSSSIDAALMKTAKRILSFEPCLDHDIQSNKMIERFVSWDEVSDDAFFDAVVKIVSAPNANIGLLKHNSVLESGALYGFVEFKSNVDFDTDDLRNSTFPLRWSVTGVWIFLYSLLKNGNTQSRILTLSRPMIDCGITVPLRHVSVSVFFAIF